MKCAWGGGRTLRLSMVGAVLCVAPVALVAQAVATPHRASASIARNDSLSAAQFAKMSARLSDQGGYFDTDNLISNESSLLHPLPVLTDAGVHGGVYVGVGPDQNFNYIAHAAPRLAIIADIRRDNLLHHLLFKALFAEASGRAEFLALWLGRPFGAVERRLQSAPVDSLIAWAARTKATSVSMNVAQRRVRERVQQFGMALSPQDLATIARFHAQFMREGVALRFTSTGRAPRDYYPTLGQLLSERDTKGVQRSYLASDRAFQVVQSLHRRNLIVPVVGDLSAGVLTRLRAVLQERRDSVTVLYTSNVEDYLIRDGRFAAFVRDVQALPRRQNGVVIRSWFGGPGSHPRNVPGYYTTQLVEPLAVFVSDPRVPTVRRYGELVARLR